jgi:trans-aconitate methyltransferase
VATIRWNAEDYARNSRGQFGWALSVIERLDLAPDARVLDIGCGDGKVTIELARRVPRGSVVGVDSSPAMVELAQRSWGQAAPNIEFRLGDAQALDFDARFDVAFSNAALHWARDQPAVLRGVAAALVAGGRTFFSMGGRGTAAAVHRALDEMKREDRWGGWLANAVSPHFFRGPEEYTGWLRDAGLEPRRVELVRKPMRHAHRAALEGWLRTTWSAFTECISDDRRAEFLSELVDRVRSGCESGEGEEILMPMVNLEVEATKPAI